ncbi:MAG TPA: PilT/PilU family type 4a pilus ATPase [Candidatus Alectryocaccomicrobium excrementavium]|uniref:PilT/PilU family type 4a pilus ATPase n=1 Tax=Candidatus Alectryocaccomicrobium excrementavium TaxID=2840668 RepID=A0A9D1K4W9_9FIRM|nr:PilT/PilU family type 4a pilus ATPase [Candidatus Alectryocaccomicrobium excrementavium]
MELMDLLTQTVEKKGSDLFIIPGAPATAKIGGALVAVSEEALRPADTERLVNEAYRLAGGRSRAPLDEGGDDDFSFSLARVSRFRCNAYRQRGSLAATYRVVAFGLPDPQALHIPDLVMRMAEMRSGMILVTGPAGSGKSTTLACMIDRINATRAGHIITIEDPIEYLHAHKKSLVSQREVPNDADTFQRALRAALREAPDVIMLGEMRDHETMQTAITAAETGHLILSSLHTVGAAKTVDRIVDTFPPNQQQQVRIQLSMVLRAVVSQRLVPVRGGQEPVFEAMAVTPAVQNMIRDGKTHQIDNVIYGGSADRSMLSMDGELERLLRAGKIDRETALRYAANPDALGRRI